MAVFATHVVVMRDFEAVKFAPGDELPVWAEDLVGAHCLEPEAEAKVDSDDADAEVDGAEDPEPDEGDVETDEPTPSSTDAPDFTTPASARRRDRTQK